MGNRHKKMFGIAMAGCITLGMLSGCSDKKVDYDTNSEETSKETSESLAQFADAEKWSDEWAVSTENGSINFVIDAQTNIPDTTSMSVVKVEDMVIDSSFIEKLVKNFFGETKIYYHDEAHWTREELEEEIENLESKMETYEKPLEDARTALEESPEDEAMYTEMIQYNESEIEKCKEKITYYQGLLENATDNYTEAAEFGECNEYLGYFNKIPYFITFSRENSIGESVETGGSLSISIVPCNYLDIAPEEMKKVTEYIVNTSMEKEPGVNRCKMSKEEAKEAAERFIQQLGFSNQVCIFAEELIWYEKRNDVAVADSAITDGYIFNYSTGIDEIAFNGIGDYSTKSYYNENYDRIYVTVMDEGVVSISIDNPVVITDITSDVELLPLSTIQRIIEDEITKNPDKYDLEELKPSNSMDLIYFRMLDDTKENAYSYIPAWRLAAKVESNGVIWYEHPLFVNAIDGSVIYFEDGWELEEE